MRIHHRDTEVAQRIETQRATEDHGEKDKDSQASSLLLATDELRKQSVKPRPMVAALIE